MGSLADGRPMGAQGFIQSCLEKLHFTRDGPATSLYNQEREGAKQKHVKLQV